jgi:hypothetical protein
MVPGEPNKDGVAKATPTQSTSVANATPGASPVDAEAMKQLKAANAKLQDDLNRMKSASQRRESELQRAAQQREREFQDELQKKAMAGMDDETRKNYERELAFERLEQMQQELEQARTEKQALEAKHNSYMFFLNKGVPRDKLALDADLETLVQSGYEYLADRSAQLEQLLSQQSTTPQAPQAPAAPASPAPLPQAPAVDLGAGATPSARPSWPDIDKEYADKGGRETFYREYEQGLISPDRIPMKEE